LNIQKEKKDPSSKFPEHTGPPVEHRFFQPTQKSNMMKKYPAVLAILPTNHSSLTSRP